MYKQVQLSFSSSKRQVKFNKLTQFILYNRHGGLNYRCLYRMTYFKRTFYLQRNWVFVTNYDFIIFISFWSNAVDLRYFKLWILIDEKNLSLKYQRFEPSGAEIYIYMHIENLNLCQKLSSLPQTKWIPPNIIIFFKNILNW